MESVEDIAAEAILDGLPWDWTSYGGYLDSIQAMKPALNIVGLAGHSSIRFEAMGDKSMDEGVQGDEDAEDDAPGNADEWGVQTKLSLTPRTAHV